MQIDPIERMNLAFSAGAVAVSAVLATPLFAFSIAIGALLAGRGGRDEWVGLGRAWGMISWLIMTTGLLLGSWWAYTILGWGGYWAWDPSISSFSMASMSNSPSSTC